MMPILHYDSFSKTIAILWNHKGFWEYDYLTSALNDDGVHIYDAAQWKYIRSIRSAIVSVIIALNIVISTPRICNHSSLRGLCARTTFACHKYICIY